MLGSVIEEWAASPSGLPADARLFVRLTRRWIHYGALGLAVAGAFIAAARNLLGW